MSLIVGLHLPTRLFLAADTRLTTTLASGLIRVEDNFWKAFSFSGDKISCVVAGNAKLATFILRKLEDSNLPKDNIRTFRASIMSQIPDVIDEYLRNGGEYKRVAIIFGGYNDISKKMVNASTFGNVQAKNLIGTNGMKNQAINHKMVEGLLSALIRKGAALEKDEEIEIDASDSLIFSLSIELPKEPIIHDIPCYDLVLFSQKQLNETHIPFDIIQKLEVETDPKNKGDDNLYQSSLVIASLINTMIEKFSLNAVGGEVLTMLLTPYGAAVPTGQIKKVDVRTGQVDLVSDITVSNGLFCRRNSMGELVPFNQIINYTDQGESEI